MRYISLFFFFFFNDTATTEIYTLSLHDALPICVTGRNCKPIGVLPGPVAVPLAVSAAVPGATASKSRSEEHTSELQSPCNLVCRLLLVKKKKTRIHMIILELYNNSDCVSECVRV